MTTARDTINEAPIGRDWDGDSAQAILDALAAAGFVVVACPPGSRVVVDRSTKPCETCGGTGMGSRWIDRSCRACDGSGVVEATTTYGLEAVPEDDVCVVHDSWRARATKLVCAYVDMIVDPRQCEFEPRYRLVALPEDGA